MSSQQHIFTKAVTFLLLLYWQLAACCPVNSYEIQRDVLVCQSRYLRRLKTHCNSNEDPFAACIQDRISAKNLSLREVQDNEAYATASSDLRLVCYTFRRAAEDKKAATNSAENERLESANELFKKRVDDLIMAVKELTTTVGSAMFFEAYALLLLSVVLQGKLSVRLGVQQALIFLLGFVIAHTLCIPLLYCPGGEYLNLERWLKNATIAAAIFHLIIKLVEERLLTIDEEELDEKKLRLFHSRMSQSSMDLEPQEVNDAKRTDNGCETCGGKKPTYLLDFFNLLSEGIFWEKTSYARDSSHENSRSVDVQDSARVLAQSTEGSTETSGILTLESEEMVSVALPTPTFTTTDSVTPEEANVAVVEMCDIPEIKTVEVHKSELLENGQGVIASQIQKTETSDELNNECVPDQCVEESKEESSADGSESDVSGSGSESSIYAKLFNESFGSNTDESDTSFHASAESESASFESDSGSSNVSDGEVQGLNDIWR